MPTDVKVLAGILALCVSFDLGRHAANRKLKKKLSDSVETSIDLWKMNLELHGELSYVISEVLNKREITLDEFDLIALPHVNVTEVPK